MVASLRVCFAILYKEILANMSFSTIFSFIPNNTEYAVPNWQCDVGNSINWYVVCYIKYKSFTIASQDVTRCLK